MQNSGLGAVSGTSHARRKYDLGDLALDVGEGVTRSAKLTVLLLELLCFERPSGCHDLVFPLTPCPDGTERSTRLFGSRVFGTKRTQMDPCCSPTSRDSVCAWELAEAD